MPKARLVLAGIIAVLCGSPAGAEDLLQVYRQALDSDPALKAAAASREAAQETKPQARALLLPSVGVAADQGYSFGISGSPTGQSSFGSHNYAISLTQPIYNRGSQVRQRLAGAVVEQSDVDFHNAQNDLILRLSQGYFGVLAALDNLTYATAAKNAFARQLEQANRRFEVGLATITDVYDAQARFDAAVSVEIDYINKLADAREFLRQLTGQDYAQLNLLSERMPLALPQPNDPEEWVRMALENNLRLRSAGYGVDQARENIDLQKAGHYPKLDLGLSRVNLDNSVTDTTSSQVNLQLTIPLYSGGAVSSQARQAAYNYEAARQSLENLQRDTIRTVRNAYRGQEAAISQIKALDQTRVSTRSALEANQAGYEVGTRTIVDVLNAERDVYLAEANYAQARYSYIANFLILRQAAGQLSEADLTEINGWLGGSRPTSGAAPEVAAAPAGKEPAKANSGKGKNGKSAAAKPVGKQPAAPVIPPAGK
ncbi:MAG: TolC family outer membrane protein [Candidatus Contendobacter sp.]|nr:TolC family outer membrane protein [Candidatus Contendobacter sp.]MDS4058021.1 TolC family outer membrane protein [Candidatus Contendobacter sp.]